MLRPRWGPRWRGLSVHLEHPNLYQSLIELLRTERHFPHLGSTVKTRLARKLRGGEQLTSGSFARLRMQNHKIKVKETMKLACPLTVQ